MQAIRFLVAPFRRWSAGVCAATCILIILPPVMAGDPPGTTYAAALRLELQNALASHGSGYLPRTEHRDADGKPRYTNRLIREDSPYLLQHAHNPVDWHAWGPAAFEKARLENKPVFLSIGYSTCHWCHVMERESFEDIEVAEFLNANFVSIKVDRERRPDIDKIYMTAVQLLGQRGGWPMSSFLTPSGDSFFGATYFPRDQFLSVLAKVSRAWQENQAELENQSRSVARAVRNATRVSSVASTVDDFAIGRAKATLINTHDAQNGGFGSKPKFPNETNYLFLLDHALRSDDKTVTDLLRFDLDAIARGGIYDHAGGGFHRYATDSNWLVPHFEKMLYNQAALARVYAQAFQLTGAESFARIAQQTLDYVLRDMTSANGAFYSATDADSEGAEGLFFLWTPAQMRRVLSKQDAALAIQLYGVTEAGNFEGANILHLDTSLSAFASNIPMAKLLTQVDRIRATLYTEREKRIHPLRDEKIVTAWNAMMILALAETAEMLQQPRYGEAALQAAEFLWQTVHSDDGQLWRVHLNGRSSVAALQEDYAWLADAFLQLYDLSSNPKWLERAADLTAVMDRLFRDESNGSYFMNSGDDAVAAMARPKDGFDNATASGNAVALRVWARLAARTGDYEPEQRASDLLAAYADAINQNPASYSYMLTASRLLESAAGPRHYAARGAVKISGQLEAGQLTVDIAIKPGWHINAHQTLQDDLVPTTIEIQLPATGWRARGSVYPQPIVKTLGFQTEALALYEGNISITTKIASTKDDHAVFLIPLSLRLQACDDRICLPPETLLLKIPTRRFN